MKAKRASVYGNTCSVLTALGIFLKQLPDLRNQRCHACIAQQGKHAGGNALAFCNLNPGMLPLLRDGRHGTHLYLMSTKQRNYFGTIP